MIAVIRSLLFLVVVILLTLVVCSTLLLCFWLPRRARRHIEKMWVMPTIWLIKHLLGIKYELRGRENLPQQPAVILCKHQSAWETIVLQEVFPDVLYVWKKELKFLPFFGWALALTPMISIDRGAGKNALNQLLTQGKLRLSQGYPVIIFPEGTRVEPGKKRRYKIGGAYLGVEAGVPVIPVALNSGEAWGRNAWLKRPGTVKVSIGPAISTAGMDAQEVNDRAEAWIEAEMRRISPDYYANETA
jgi:1-acyl-sn-glycerol-3-phosphate acyltransferase